MKVIGVVGSPRKTGNTSALIREALKPIAEKGVETEVLYLDDYDFRDCNGCEGCKDSFRCIVNDDMQKLYPKILESDALILGSPTYFYNISAKMKAFIDRLYCFEIIDVNDRSIWMGLNEILGIKYGVVIGVCEQANEEDMGFTTQAMEMPLQALGYRVISTVKAIHLFNKNDAKTNNKALQDAYLAGEKLLKTLELKEAIKLKLL